MIQIKPVKVGLPSQDATQILIRPIIGSTTDLCCNTYYEVIGQKEIERVEEVTTQDEEGNDIVTTTTVIDTTTTTLQTGNHKISEEEYAERGSDNTYIEDLVLDYLGLERL